MRVAVIGLGSIGTRHVGNLLALGCDVYAYDPSIEARSRVSAQHPMARVFGLLGGDEQFDAMVIATPADSHASVVESIRPRFSGPLFVEKPLALSVEECDVFRHWPHQTTMVGYNLRFHSWYQRFQSRQLDIPKAGWFRIAAPLEAKYGPALSEFSHEIDLPLFLGVPAFVTSAKVTACHRRNCYEIRLADRFLVQLEVTGGRYERRWSIRREGFYETQAFFAPADLGGEMYEREMKHFLDCAERGIPTITPFADGLRVLDVIEQVRRMAL